MSTVATSSIAAPRWPRSRRGSIRALMATPARCGARWWPTGCAGGHVGGDRRGRSSASGLVELGTVVVSSTERPTTVSRMARNGVTAMSGSGWVSSTWL